LSGELNPNLQPPLGRLSSLDHFVRPVQHRLWDRQPDLPGGFEIDYKLELCGLL
jgi:hypothetical protein